MEQQHLVMKLLVAIGKKVILKPRTLLQQFNRDIVLPGFYSGEKRGEVGVCIAIVSIDKRHKPDLMLSWGRLLQTRVLKHIYHY